MDRFIKDHKINKLDKAKLQKTVDTIIKTQHQKGGFPLLNLNQYTDANSFTTVGDATPSLSRPGIPSTFGGAFEKKYKFIAVSELKKLDTKHNKYSAEHLNKLITRKLKEEYKLKK